MKSKYIQRLIFKDWFPLIIVFLTVATLSFIIYLSNLDIYESLYNRAGPQMLVVSMTVPFTLLAFIMPLFVYNYKFSLKSSDTFYQLPFKEKEMRNLRVITGLISIISSLVICFLIGFIFFIIRYYTSPTTIERTFYSYYYDAATDTGKPIAETASYLKNAFYPGMFILVLPIAMVGIALEYFISCFLVSLTNKPFTAILFNGSIQLFLLLIIPSIFLMIEHFSDTPNDFGQCQLYALILAPGLMFANGLPSYLSASFIMNNQPVLGSLEGLTSFVFAASISLAVIIGAVAAFLVFYMKEPSGEHSGNYGLNKATYNFAIYLSAIPVVLLLASLDGKNLSLYLFLDAVIVAGYYFLNTMFLGTFKIKKYHYFIIGGLAALLLIAYFI